MVKLKYFIYEIGSTSVGLGLLAFLGTLSFLPIDIMIMGEGQTVTWLFIILSISLIAAFLLLSFVKRKFLLLRILNILTILMAILVINTFLIFTQDLFEPWLIQVGWFLRYNGFIVGVFLGIIAIQTVTGLSLIISEMHKFKELEGGEDKGSNKKIKLLTFLVFGICIFFYICEMLVFRYSTFLAALLLIFFIEMSFLAFSIIELSFSNYFIFIKTNFFGNTGQNAVNTSENHKISDQNSSGGKIFSSINSKLEKAETNNSRFWHLFVPLLPLLILGIFLAIIFPFNFLMHVAFPYGVGVIEWDVPITQVFSYLLIAFVFFVLTFFVYIGRIKRRLEAYYPKGRKTSMKMIAYGSLDAMRFLGIFLVISQVLYFFEYIMYLPEVVSLYLVCGGIGGAIYYFLGRTPNLRKIMYIISILLLTLNMYLTYIDGLAYASNTYSGEFILYFPFMYLHSWPNFLLVGIPSGILLSDLLLNVAFTHNDGGDSVKRSLLIAITPFMLGMLMVPGAYLNDNPGGNPPLTPQDYTIFFYFCLVLGILLVLGLCMNYLITEILVPRFVERKSKTKDREVSRNKSVGTKKNNSRSVGTSKRKRIMAISLMGIMVFSFMGSWSIYNTFSQTYQRPIIINDPDNYCIWIQNSSERVSRDVVISDMSPHIDVVEITMAKNEYAAIQLVWRPYKAIQSLSFVISDFSHQNDSFVIRASNCSLRLVDFIIEDEFPDLLRPFSVLDLVKGKNNVFWFAVRTPYEALEGSYEGNITFDFNSGQKAVVTIQLNVWNFTVPNMRHLRTNIGVRSDSYTKINNYLDHRLNDYGVDILYTSSLAQLNTVEKYTCYLNTGTNTWTFNWTWWDNMIQYKLDNGINAFTVDYPLGIADGRDPYIEDSTRMLRLKNWLSDVESHLENKSWLDYGWLYFIDEFNVFIPTGYSRAEYFNRCRILLSEIKLAAPKIKIMTTTPPSQELQDLREYIDIFCPISNDRDKERWDERLAADCEFWTYTCVGPLAPWPNAQLYNRLWEIRVLMWQVWLYDIQGFLYWHSSSYYHGDYGFAYNGYGDGWFLYEMDGQLYDSLRWEMFLEGQEDYEYLWLLNATLQYLENHPGLISQQAIDDYRSELETIVNSIAGERWIYCDHVETIYSGRDRVGVILHELGSIVNITAIGEALWLPPYRPGA